MIIGVDTGGTKTLIASFDDDGNIVSRQKFLTPRDIQTYTSQVASTILDLIPNRADLRGIAVAVPGLVENNIAISCKNLGWQNIDIISRLQSHFPDIPMWLENDANLGAIGATNLLSPGPKRCLYITISTGIGSGLVINGSLSQDISSSEVGDMIVEYQGELKSWEGIASGGAIIKEFGVYASELKDGQELNEVAKRISRGLLTLLPTLRPDIVAVGGGVGAHYSLFAADIDSELQPLRSEYRCPIITAPYPEEIVAYGCYFYAKTQLGL